MPGKTDPSDVTSAWLKFGWAYRHAVALQREIAEHAHGDPVFATRTEYDPKLHAIRLLVDSIEPMPRRIGLHLGDFVNCARSTLDHVAWAVTRGTPDIDFDPRDVYFPFARSWKDLKSARPKRLPGITGADFARIRRHQPYRTSARMKRLLALLVELVNHDKHREIQPVWAVTYHGRMSWKLTGCTRSPGPRRGGPRHGRLEVNTEVGRVYVRRTGPHPDADVHGDFTTFPAVGDSVPMEVFLNWILAYLEGLLSEFGPPPAELFELGIRELTPPSP